MNEVVIFQVSFETMQKLKKVRNMLERTKGEKREVNTLSVYTSSSNINAADVAYSRANVWWYKGAI